MPSTDAVSASQLWDQLTDWSYFVLPARFGRVAPHLLEHDFWLGNSRDGDTWCLAIATADGTSLRAAAFLSSPTRRSQEVIARILLEVHIADVAGTLPPSMLGTIATSTPFPTLPSVAHYLPTAPAEWVDMPAELAVGFELSEHACVSESTFEEFSRDTFVGAIDVLCGPRHEGLLITYALVAREVVPLLEWNVDWPLSRRGRTPPSRRDRVQGDVPWRYRPDTSLLRLYQHLPSIGSALTPSYYARPVVYLQAGGRTPEAAIHNWEVCARALRKLRPASAR